MQLRRILTSVVLCCCWLVSQHLRADEAITLKAGAGRVSLLSHAGWVHDSGGDWSVADARHQQFQSLTNWQLGRWSGALWLRIPLRNDSDHDLSLVLDTGDEHTERVEFFVIDPVSGAVLQTAIAGISLPYADRIIQSQSLVFPLQLAAQQQVDVYLRLSSRFNIEANLAVYDTTSFANRIEHHNTLEALFYGILIALIVYNAVFAIYVREREYLFFIGFLTSWTLLFATGDGFIYRIWPYALLGAYTPAIFYALYGLAFITLSLFTNVYLRLKKIARYLAWMQYLFIAWGVFIAIGPSLIGYENSYRASLLLMVLMIIVDVYTGWVVYRARQRFALEYTASFALMLMMMILLTWGFYGGGAFIRIVFFFPALLFSIGIGNRIGELKKEAILLQKNAELANYAAEFKSRFLATMSHEIRTPMNGVLGMVELLKDSHLDHSQRQYLDIIDGSGKALLSVINDILDFTRLESGNILLEKLSIRLELIIDECISIFSTTCRGRDLEFTVEISPQLPSHFMGDPTRLKQVLINLLGNAFKFTERGLVSLRVFEQHEHEQAQICFAVTDTGVGISPEALRALFTPFAQADNSITRRFGGTGLGLAISKQLVDAMGGRIAVESILSRGTTFTVYLPLIAGEEVAGAPPVNELAVKDKRILLVDDHAPFAHATQQMLQRWGLHVILAGSGSEALDLLSRQVFDFILLDLYLPDGNGLEFVDAFRACAGHRDVAIITVSSSDQIPHSDDLQRFGIVRHMIKPFQFSLLRHALVQALGTADDFKTDELNAIYGQNGLRVLVVEDNATNQIVISSMLKKLGVDFEVVDNGQQAVERVRQIFAGGQSLDGILMDCEMPVMDGYTATRTIRSLEKEKSAPPLSIIGLSAHAMEEFRNKALNAGMTDYLIKPVKMAALGSALENLKNNASEPLKMIR